MLGAWPDEGDLPGPASSWKSVEEVQVLLLEVGMRQAICTEAFQGPTKLCFLLVGENRLLQAAPQSGIAR